MKPSFAIGAFQKLAEAPDFRFFGFWARQHAHEHMQVTALAGHMVDDPATRAMVTILIVPPGGCGVVRIMSLTCLNANEFPFCAFTSGVPLDSRSRSPSGVRCAAHAQLSSRAWGSRRRSDNRIYGNSRTAASNSIKQTSTSLVKQNSPCSGLCSREGNPPGLFGGPGSTQVTLSLKRRFRYSLALRASGFPRARDRRQHG